MLPPLPIARYAGGHINGIARIKYGVGTAWEWINFNLLGEDLWQNETIVPQISIDPENGDVYCLLTGNRAIGSPRDMASQARTGIYRMPRGGSRWILLRGQVTLPAAFAGTKPWQYPTGQREGGRRGALIRAQCIQHAMPSVYVESPVHCWG